MSVRELPSHPRTDRVLRGLRLAVRRVSFWSAVALPFVSLALLVTGLDTTSETVAFLVLIAVNLLAFVGGRQYAA